jgi:hypothetical protein
MELGRKGPSTRAKRTEAKNLLIAEYEERIIMSFTKRQHFVPQMLLRRFVNTDGRLYFFNKNFPEKRVLASPPKDVFVQNHIYTERDKHGNKDNSLEEMYAEIEGQANGIIEKIIVAARAKQTPNLSLDERAAWDLFFYYQFKRVPDFYNNIKIMANFEQHMAAALIEFESKFRPLTDEERREFQNPNNLERIKKNALISSLSDPGSEVQETLSRKGLGVGVITKPNKSFIIGSFPVVKLTYPGRENFNDPSVEVWFPISPDVAVTPIPEQGIEKIVQITGAHHVRAINLAISGQSTIIAGHSKALIESLARPR